MHKVDHRSNVVDALKRVGYDTACDTMASAMSGAPPEHFNDGSDSQIQRNIGWGYAGVLAASPDFGQNDVETDCADAIASIIHYAVAACADLDIAALMDRARRFVDDENAEDIEKEA